MSSRNGNNDVFQNDLEVAGIRYLVAQWLKTVEFIENALKLKRLN